MTFELLMTGHARNFLLTILHHGTNPMRFPWKSHSCMVKPTDYPNGCITCFFEFSLCYIWKRLLQFQIQNVLLNKFRLHQIKAFFLYSLQSVLFSGYWSCWEMGWLCAWSSKTPGMMDFRWWKFHWVFPTNLQLTLTDWHRKRNIVLL